MRKILRILLCPVLLVCMSPLFMVATIMGIVALLEGTLKVLSTDTQDGYDELKDAVYLICAPVLVGWQWIQKPKGMFSSNPL